MSEQEAYARQRLASSMMSVGHGDLAALSIAMMLAVVEDAEFAHRLMAYNAMHGKVRDSKIAWPVAGLRLPSRDDELAENSIAHMAQLGPRELYKAYQENKRITATGPGYNIPYGYRRMLEGMLVRYLEVREANQDWWDKTAVSSRQALTGLYAVAHKKPSTRAQAVLFDKKYPGGSVFEAIRQLPDMEPRAAAGAIIHHSIPVPIALGAVKDRSDVHLWVALLEQMTGNQARQYTDTMKKLGIFTNPILVAAYEACLERAKSDRRVDVGKLEEAAKRVGGTKVARAVEDLKQAQVDRLQDIEANVLVLGDRSGSMSEAIILSRKVAAIVAAKVKGNTHLVFFDSSPLYYDATGKSLTEIEAITRRVSPGGSTSIGCGLDYILARNILVNAIVVVTDGGENAHPLFSEVYKIYSERMGIEPAITVFLVRGSSPDVFTSGTRAYSHQGLKDAGIPFDVFDLRQSGVDDYALPNLVSGIYTQRYGLIDAIMGTQLLTLEEVFK